MLVILVPCTSIFRSNKQLHEFSLDHLYPCYTIEANPIKHVPKENHVPTSITNQVLEPTVPYRYLDRSIIALHPLKNQPFECASSTQTYQIHPMHGQKNTSTSYFWVEGIVRPLLPCFCTRYTIFVDDRLVHEDLAVTSQSASKVWFLPLRLCSSLK